jgi:hypothetical protein
MPITDALQLKERIISIIDSQGPILPVQVAKQTGLSILFASAFLSELYNEKRLNISSIRVGSSPLYFIPGQESLLEKFSSHLKNREKDAFMLLKDSSFLKDSEQLPAIRVALREIKDFAVPFQKGEEIFWKFFTASEPEFKDMDNSIEKQQVSDEKQILPETEMQQEEIKEPKTKKTQKKKPAQKAKKQKKSDENFFNKIKEFLAKKGIEILDIKNFKNEEALFKVSRNNSEELLFIFNRKKITEKEVLKAGKLALESGMNYSIYHLGENPKKLEDLISAVKNLTEIGRIE